jgi:hypothetical protein
MKTIITLNPPRVIQVKNTLIHSNLLQLKEIEKYQRQHSSMSMEQAAVQWIDKNAAQWRAKHPLAI